MASIPPTWTELANGLKIVSRRNRSIPVVQLRIAVLAGSSTDGEFTGLSALCAKSVASSGAGTMNDTELQGKLESLGATLDVDVDADRVVYGLSVVKDRLGDAFDLLAQVVSKPRLKTPDVIRVQSQLTEEAAENARGDGQWGVLMTLHRDLFELPTEHHPYASYDATADDFGKLKPAACKDWHRKYFVASNMLVAASGDVEPEQLRSIATKTMGTMRKASAPSVSFTDPMPPASMKITLVDRPGSTQSEVAVGMLGPKETDTGYASFVVADQLIGGAFTGRLSQDLREQKGLAYLTFSMINVYANGPSVFYLYAQTQNDSTGKALAGLLDHATKLADDVPSPSEVETASRFLVGMRAIEHGRPRYAAAELCESWAHKQSDDAADELDKAIRRVGPDEVRRSFAEYARLGHTVIVVAGDAASIGSQLQSFGEVKVVDPTRNFARIRTLPSTEK
jgi:predicted Zn-dependent peptidase